MIVIKISITIIIISIITIIIAIITIIIITIIITTIIIMLFFFFLCTCRTEKDCVNYTSLFFKKQHSIIIAITIIITTTVREGVNAMSDKTQATKAARMAHER